MNSKTKLCCLIGNPVEHSISPLIHNTLAEKLDINMVYAAFAVETEDVGSAISGAEALKFHGLNVTVPHKCTVIPFLKEIDPLAEKIGAVNTLVPCEGGYKGYNTDIIGLYRELCDEGLSIDGKDFIIIGAGGAAKAIVYLLASKGANRVWLLNRSLDKAELLANEVNAEFGEIVCPKRLTEYSDIPKNKYTIIQTTNVGMYPACDVAAIEDEAFYELCGAGVDIIFNPTTTRFMNKCMQHGAPAYNGLKMLLYQGIAAFELWNKIEVPKELAEFVYFQMKKEMNID